ncbi:MAG: flagellar protein [Defluviitaleaceae bacterium]|nr:flagellar protein [Defluviitaleaceae bacterium]MCL2275301.1 flagellar protein [Defluviitaleaceae bacterium]
MIPNNMRTTPVGIEQAVRQITAQPVQAPAVSFRDVLFSKHAALRLDSRDIQLSDDQMQRLGTAIVKAQEKGIRDSLVLMDDVALVVNVRSRTVITAMEQQASGNVFSNIDGTVII